MEKLRELEAKVIGWANERNFFGEGGATLFGQYLKLREEFGELSGNFAKGRCMKDDIGDVAVVLIIMNKLLGRSFDYSDLESEGYKEWVKNTSISDKYLATDQVISNFIKDSDSCKMEFDSNFFIFDGAFFQLKAFAESSNYNFSECLEHAYNEIKDRKGEWRNNTFVKESDL